MNDEEPIISNNEEPTVTNNEEIINNNDQIEKLATMSNGLSASDIVGICQKAGISVLMDGRNSITFNDIKKEI